MIKHSVKELQSELRKLVEEEKEAIAALNEFKKMKNELLIEQLELTSILTEGKKEPLTKPKDDDKTQEKKESAQQEAVKNEPVRLNLDVDKLLTTLVEGQYYASDSEHDSDDDSLADERFAL